MSNSLAANDVGLSLIRRISLLMLERAVQPELVLLLQNEA
jgi:hypothetical protein